MGCDIHMHCETRTRGLPARSSAPADWEWRYIEGREHIEGRGGRFGYFLNKLVWHRRYYQAFGLLAGVRDSTVPPIAPPRGVPLDATEETRRDYETCGDDGHDHSWVTLAEISARGFDGLRDVAAWRDWVERMLLWAATEGIGPEDVRFVFWFDN